MEGEQKIVRSPSPTNVTTHNSIFNSKLTPSNFSLLHPPFQMNMGIQPKRTPINNAHTQQKTPATIHRKTIH